MAKLHRSAHRLARPIGLAALLLAALTAVTLGGYTLARQNRTRLEYGYQRARGELTEYLRELL